MTAFAEFRDMDFWVDGTVASFYEREFYPFCNFSAFQVEWHGRTWMTAEHAYHAASFMEVKPEYVEKILAMRSAHEAYEFAKQHISEIRTSWPNEQVETLEDILHHKTAQHAYVQKKLRDSGDAPIVCDSPFDEFWGCGKDRQGRNELGKIWMRLRKELDDGRIKKL